MEIFKPEILLDFNVNCSINNIVNKFKLKKIKNKYLQ